MSHWIRRKNSQLNKRRPTARPTHSTGSHAWTWDHTHTYAHEHAHILHELYTWSSTCTHLTVTHSCAASLPRVCCLLKQCFSFTLNLSDAAFDKFAIFAVVIFISSTGFFSSCCTYHVSEEIYSISRAHGDKVLFMVWERTALSHKWLTKRTNTVVEGITHLLTLSFLFQPTDTINAGHLFNRIRR